VAAASDEEAAAMVATVEQFLRHTTPVPAPAAAEPPVSPWKRAALLDGVTRQLVPAALAETRSPK
jgi:hypothetical protein